VEAFTLHGMPSDARAETNLQTTAQQIAAGTISAIHGELDLHQMRTRKHGSRPAGYLNREIEGTMNLALREGLLGLRRQRIIAANSLTAVPAPLSNQPPTAPSDGSDTKLMDDGERREIIEFMRLIEKWRMGAGSDGGKITQDEAARRMNLDRRAYSAAKKGEPRGNDHLDKIRSFARSAGLI
jgi:hypothetical protein